MKCYIGLLIVLLPCFALAQDRRAIDSLARNKITSLTDSWSLGISDSADMDIEVYNKYKLLFNSGATVQDDLNVFYEYGGYKKPGTYKPDGRQKLFDIYAHDVALAVLIRTIPFDSVTIVPVTANDPATRIFRVKRTVEFQKTARYVLPDTYAEAVVNSRHPDPNKDSLQRAMLLSGALQKNEDSVYKFTSNETLSVTMVFDKELNDMVITNITTITNNIRCTNDEDRDGIPDNQDSLAASPGDFTANGRPDYDLDGIGDADDKCPLTFGSQVNQGCPVDYFYTKFAFDVSAGGLFGSAKLNLPELTQLGYTTPSGDNGVDASLSKKGTLKNPGVRAGFQGGINLVYYFGKKERRSGISTGVNYARLSSGKYEVTNPIMYTFRSLDNNGESYRRRVTIDSLTEHIRHEMISIPVLFNYRWHPKGHTSTVLKIQAGPSLTMFGGLSEYNAKINFEGIYQIDSTGKNHTTYIPFNQASIYNVFFTEEALRRQNKGVNTDEIFQQLNAAGYDFGIGKKYTGTQSLPHRLAIAFNAGFDLQQKVSESLTVKAGVNFVSGFLFERKEKYIPIDKTADGFRSVY